MSFLPFGNINPEIIRSLDSGSYIPVVAPIGVGPGGSTYNINADLVAGSLAVALQADKLILLTDVPGIMAAVVDYPEARTHPAVQ